MGYFEKMVNKSIHEELEVQPVRCPTRVCGKTIPAPLASFPRIWLGGLDAVLLDGGQHTWAPTSLPVCGWGVFVFHHGGLQPPQHPESVAAWGMEMQAAAGEGPHPLAPPPMLSELSLGSRGSDVIGSAPRST